MNPTVDEAAFEAALVSLYPRLLRCAERLSLNRADAQDLVQDALERGLRRRALFRTGGAPDRWMTTILRRIFLDRRRSAHRQGETHAVAAREAGDGVEVAVPARASDLFDAADLRRAVGLLEQPFRDVYSLFAFEHLSHREIGRRLAMPTSTVGTRLMRARQRLRAILEANDIPAVPARVRRWEEGAPAPLEIVGAGANCLRAQEGRVLVAL
jgi:RNA polymerase sigma-70 factor (ECF subfamily)